MTRLLTFKEAAKSLGINQQTLLDAVFKRQVAYEALEGTTEIMFAPDALNRLKPTIRRRETVKNAEPSIYVVGFGPYVKIGLSRNLKDRFEKIQTHAPEKITVYRTFPGGLDVERQLHEGFAPYRLNGEWFRHEGQLAAWIKEGCPYDAG